VSSRRIGTKDCEPAWCPIEVSLEVIGGLWKVIIVRELLEGTKRYSQLHRALKRVTHKMLAQQLRELERDGVVNRKVYPQVPPKVEYSLTPLGEALSPLLDSMHAWGDRVIARRKRAASIQGHEPGRQPRVRGRYVNNSEKLAGRALLSTARGT
jgi:DNA-binding HxlR family transcriptional regulator